MTVTTEDAHQLAGVSQEKKEKEEYRSCEDTSPGTTGPILSGQWLCSRDWSKNCECKRWST